MARCDKSDKQRFVTQLLGKLEVISDGFLASGRFPEVTTAVFLA